jgi:hypothetical protein
MAKEVLEMEIKSNIGEVTKETKELTNNFGAFGITIGGIKDKFKDVSKIMINGLKQVALQARLAGVGFKKMFSGDIIGGAKTLFTVIKTGIAATGIGLLIVAFGSLLTFFTKTKKGAELLEVAFAGIGAAINVITDRVSKFGGAIVKLFSGNFKGALTDIKGAFTGIGTEIANDTKQAIALKQAFIALRDSERELNVETAQRRADIEELKLIAEDVTKSEKERLKAAEKAFGIETDLLERRIKNAEKAVRIESARLKDILDPEAEALDNLAQKEIELATIRGESVTKQIELNNKINSIKQETINKNEQLRIQNEAEVAQVQSTIDRLTDIRQKDDNARELQELLRKQKREIEAAEEIKDEKLKFKELTNLRKIHQEEYLKLVDKQSAVEVDGNKKSEKSTTDTAEARLAAFSGLANALSGLAGDNKELAAAGAIIDTYAGANKAFQQGGVAGFVTGAAIIAAGLNNVQKIYSTPVGDSGGGGETPAATTPAPQMMSGAFQLGGGVKPEPMKAFVVTDEMSNSQSQLANIRRRATI